MNKSTFNYIIEYKILRVWNVFLWYQISDSDLFYPPFNINTLKNQPKDSFYYSTQLSNISILTEWEAGHTANWSNPWKQGRETMTWVDTTDIMLQ